MDAMLKPNSPVDHRVAVREMARRPGTSALSDGEKAYQAAARRETARTASGSPQAGKRKHPTISKTESFRGTTSITRIGILPAIAAVRGLPELLDSVIGKIYLNRKVYPSNRSTFALGHWSLGRASRNPQLDQSCRGNRPQLHVRGPDAPNGQSLIFAYGVA